MTKTKNITSEKIRLYMTVEKFKLQKKDLEYPKGKTLTIPNQSYSIQEILEKYSIGQAPLVGLNGSYSDDPDFDDPAPGSHDLTERDEAIEELSQLQRTLSEAKQGKGKPRTQGPGGRVPEEPGRQTSEARPTDQDPRG